MQRYRRRPDLYNQFITSHFEYVRRHNPTCPVETEEDDTRLAREDDGGGHDDGKEG